MSDLVCHNCRGQTTAGCWLCNPDAYPAPYADPLDKSYWPSEAGRLAAENAFLTQRIAELEAKIESLRTCKTCGQDKVVAEIGERFGYRADIMALRVREVEAALKRVRGLPTYKLKETELETAMFPDPSGAWIRKSELAAACDLSSQSETVSQEAAK